MTAHSCTSLDPACYRCELGRDEIDAASEDMLLDAQSYLDAAAALGDDHRPAAEFLREEAADLLADAQSIQQQVMEFDLARRKLGEVWA